MSQECHAINQVNGKSSIAYVGERPWHGLGQALTEGAPLQTWLEEAGLSYDVMRSPAAFMAGVKVQNFKGRDVLYRSDTLQPLSIMSGSYKIVQPREIMEFFRDLTEVYGFTLETAGALFDGQKYWALARTPESFTLAGGDKVDRMLLLSSSCDGSTATSAMFTSVRVVCRNTLTWALGDKHARAVKVYHSKTFNPKEVKHDLGIYADDWGQFAARCQLLSKTRVSDSEAVQFMIKLMGDPTKPVEEQPRAKTMATVLKLVKEDGMGHALESANGTLWGLLNGVTEYVDHHYGKVADRSLDNALFWGGKKLKEQAFAQAVEWAEAV